MGLAFAIYEGYIGAHNFVKPLYSKKKAMKYFSIPPKYLIKILNISTIPVSNDSEAFKYSSLSSNVPERNMNR